MAEPAKQNSAPTVGYRPGARYRPPVSTYAVKITLCGRVQGVGFRPFVYRLAKEYGLTGHVQNKLGDVEILACGRPQALKDFRHDLISRAPPLSEPRIVKLSPVDTLPFEDFLIISSSAEADARIFVPPDYFMCDDCRLELQDPDDRRYRYPFINCTQCGPRYTLIESLPYDRQNTSMARFDLCADCSAEYGDPVDRRFHAEPVACPACGPRLSFSEPLVADSTLAENAALEQLRLGKIVAVKGIGGYHLMCDARNVDAVARLRRRKQRPGKPLAVMFPIAGSDGLDSVRRYANLTDCEADLMTSPMRPIVLTAKKPGTDLAANIAPELGELGAFLPYSPLHQLLLDEFAAPLVATSGNISGEPVLTDNEEATQRLAGIADAFLHHDRPIVRPADDPVYRRIAGSMRPLRMGRGAAPCELELPWQQTRPTLAVGGHMKGAIALSWDRRVVVSPHIGEMDSPRSLAVFERLVRDLQALYGVEAERIVCDAHPGYTTHRWAKQRAVAGIHAVWHHHAHASAVAAEHARHGQWLMFTWDGVGLGEDGSLWGGEALLGKAGSWRRVASLRTFRPPGGERAGREPWRSAAALHWECGQHWYGCPDSDGLAAAAWRSRLNSPVTSAVGRLFDAAAATVLNLTHTSFEAEGPMLLEALCRDACAPVYLPLEKGDDGIWRSNWQPLLAMLGDEKLGAATRAEIIHSSLAQVILQQAQCIQDDYAVDQVGLCGGVFQNRVLTEQAVESLERHGFHVYLPQKLPCNDAALCYGQAAEIAARDGDD